MSLRVLEDDGLGFEEFLFSSSYLSPQTKAASLGIKQCPGICTPGFWLQLHPLLYLLPHPHLRNGQHGVPHKERESILVYVHHPAFILQILIEL